MSRSTPRSVTAAMVGSKASSASGTGGPLGPGQQDVDEVVDHQGDLDGVDRLQLDHAG
jgi:hypothetical protein